MSLILNGDTGISGVDGAAATPAVQGNDTNTGMFFPAADTIAFAEGGTEVMRIDSSGNVGIGTTSPASSLDVQAPDARSIIRLTATTGTNPVYSRASNTGGFLYLGRDGSGGTDFGAGAYAAGVWSTGAYPMVFGTNGTERMRIDSTGNVSITQTPGKYTVDTTGGQTSIANGGTVDYANASGMLVVNNHVNGAVTIWLCGSGSTTAIGSVTGQVGTFAYVPGIAGYRWTNNYGSTATFGFFFVRTRQTA